MRQPIKLNREDTDTALHLLLLHLSESERRVGSDTVLRQWVTQGYDFLNRIGYTDARPRWELPYDKTRHRSD